MNPLTTLELTLSLSVQVALLIGVAAYFARRRFASSNADLIWAAAHIAILLVTMAAFLLPHLRLATWADLHPTTNYPAGRTTLQVLGCFAGWAWAIGAVGIGLLGIAGMIKATAIVRDAETDNELRSRLLDSVPGLASCSRPIDIRVLGASFGAFCWQIHRPVIALPDVVLEFPIGEQAAIARHELTRIRAGSIRSTCSCSGWSRPFTGFIRWCGGRRAKRRVPERFAAIETRSLPVTKRRCIYAACCG